MKEKLGGDKILDLIPYLVVLCVLVAGAATLASHLHSRKHR
jgi:hypothetical protein